jgi:Domain of unknown function DUF488
MRSAGTPASAQRAGSGPVRVHRRLASIRHIPGRSMRPCESVPAPAAALLTSTPPGPNVRTRQGELHFPLWNTMTLFTFGYEGVSIDAFVARLKSAGVRTVLDVRQLPLSRKRGFSKNAFGAALHEADIVYAHLPALGCPRPIRDAYKGDGDWPAYVRAFDAYLAGQEEALAEVGRIAGKTVACLVCFEADFNRCHRSIVARATARAGRLRVVHLTIRGEIPDAPAHLAA